MVLSGLVPIVNGQPFLTAQYGSLSGTQYSTQGVLPEPGSLLLLGTGVAALAIRWRKRR
jgi:hypothetical protein